MAASGNSRCKGPVVARNLGKATPRRRNSMCLERGAVWVRVLAEASPCGFSGVLAFYSKILEGMKDLRRDATDSDLGF